MLATIKTSIMIEDRMSKQFAAMNMAMLSVIDSFEQLETASGNAIDVSALRQAQTQLQQLESSFNQVEQEIHQSERAQESFNQDLRSSDGLAKRLLGTLGAIVGTYMTLQGVGQALNISDEMTNTKARLNLLVDEMPVVRQDLNQLDLPLTADVAVNVKTNTDELADLSSTLSQIDRQIPVDVSVLGMSDVEIAQQMIFDAAQRSYSSFKDTADMVSRIGTNARDAFDNVAEVVAFAELVQKQFGIAGASAVEASNATIQLSQALASGVLRGDELNSIFEQAPNLIMSIADYLEVPIGAIREMAADGQITADIVKNAMFAAANDINAKFESMPTTWSQIWTAFKNDALWAFSDVLGYINAIANSDNMKGFLNDLKGHLFALAEYVLQILQTISSVGSFIYENWSLLSPIIGGVTAALIANAGAWAWVNRGIAINALMVLTAGLRNLWYVATTVASTLVTYGFTAAMAALSLAIAANPIAWLIGAIIVLVSLFYLAIAVVNHFAGTSISATGIIIGAFAALGAFIFNLVAAMWNIFAALAEFFVNVWQHPIHSVKALFANLANVALSMAESMIGSFDSAATNLANMFVDAANIAINAINWVSDAINNLTGINFGKMGTISHRTSVSADYSGLRGKIDDWVGEAPASYWKAPKMDMKSIPDAFSSGYQWGADLFNTDKLKLDSLTPDFGALTDLAGLNLDDLAAGVGGLGDKIDKGNAAGRDTAKNTGKLADTATLLDDDLKYLRDLAEREAINRYTTAEISIDARSENHISSEADLDGIIDGLVEKLEEAAEIAAEGGEYDV